MQELLQSVGIQDFTWEEAGATPACYVDIEEVITNNAIGTGLAAETQDGSRSGTI